MADEPVNPPGQEFLDQSEIDRLLAQTVVENAPRSLLLRADGQRGDAAAASKVEAYDFRNPAFLSEVELRRLREFNQLAAPELVTPVSGRLARWEGRLDLA